MKRLNTEVAVGVFLIAGFLCFAYLAVKLGDVHLFGSDSYTLSARFSSVSGLKDGATIEIAGVTVGQVGAITLDQQTYRAVIRMDIRNGVEITEDSIASIRTSGIIGDRYVSISPGGSMDILKDGDEIIETESAINIEQLISKYIFEKN